MPAVTCVVVVSVMQLNFIQLIMTCLILARPLVLSISHMPCQGLFMLNSKTDKRDKSSPILEMVCFLFFSAVRHILYSLLVPMMIGLCDPLDITSIHLFQAFVH